ncbi:MAG: CDP-diacylglycerol--glycerol-3-phosphate 3-phosphatidyltransferase [Victivallales bacterium]|nr:CDP-diacylglycerol--glycerol-3-phosphate 3-phosphatidyltransferase [Victivallales bacterium]
MNIPNQITVARIVMVFIFLALANVKPGEFFSETFARQSHIVAYVVAILAGLTDLIDGWVARRFNMVTDFGKLMDPLADKIFIVATFLMCVEQNLMPAWIAVIVISREFLVTGLRTLAAQQGEVIAADRWGKLKTLSQMLMLLIAGADWNSFIFLRTTMLWNIIPLWVVWQYFLWAIVLVTVLSGIGYFYRHRHLYINSI